MSRGVSPHSSLRSIVTGSGGFIGRHLTVRLRSEGHDVVEWKRNLRDVAAYDQPVDVVFHLAAVVRHDRFTAAPYQSYDVNVTGTLAVLNYCKKVGARCVLTSTSAVYQSPQDQRPISEEAPVEPVLPYAISKGLAESICRQQAKDLGTSCVVLRLFNVYGPGQDKAFLVSYVVDCLIQRRPIVLRMPEAYRDFVYVGDVVDALVRTMQLTTVGCKVFNIGSGQAVRVRDLVSLAERVFGSAVGIEVVGSHPGELPAIIADITRAREELGWVPQYDLQSGLMAIKSSLEPASVPR